MIADTNQVLATQSFLNSPWVLALVGAVAAMMGAIVVSVFNHMATGSDRQLRLKLAKAEYLRHKTEPLERELINIANILQDRFAFSSLNDMEYVFGMHKKNSEYYLVASRSLMTVRHYLRCPESKTLSKSDILLRTRIEKFKKDIPNLNRSAPDIIPQVMEESTVLNADLATFAEEVHTAISQELERTTQEIEQLFEGAEGHRS